tara:strand:+ start:3253 stop:6372 length:3120 start_codon:yes stop_codon:yes gene_type:complete
MISIYLIIIFSTLSFCSLDIDTLQKIELQTADSLSKNLYNKIIYNGYLNPELDDVAVKSYEKELEELVNYYEKNLLIDNSWYDFCIHNLYLLNMFYLDKQKALYYLKKRITINQTTKDSISLSQSYQNVSYFYQDLEDYKNTISYADSAYKCALATRNKTTILTSSEYLSRILEKEDIVAAKFYLDIALKYALINQDKELYVNLLIREAWWEKKYHDEQIINKLKKIILYIEKNNMDLNDYRYLFMDVIEYLFDYGNYLEAKKYSDKLEKTFINIDYTQSKDPFEFYTYIDFLTKTKRPIYDSLFENLNDIDNQIMEIGNIIKDQIESTADYFDLFIYNKILYITYMGYYDYEINEEQKNDYYNLIKFYIDQALLNLDKSYNEIEYTIDSYDYYIREKIELLRAKLIHLDHETNMQLKVKLSKEHIDTCENLINDIITLDNSLWNHVIVSLNEQIVQCLKFQEISGNRIIKTLKDMIQYSDYEITLIQIYRAISTEYYWMGLFDRSKEYNLKALNLAKETTSINYLRDLYYELAEININQNDYASAIPNLIKSQNYSRTLIQSYSLNQERNYINNDPRIIQLLSYCYHKTRLPELIIPNADYYKSYKNKGKLGIKPDIEEKFLDIQKKLKPNEAIIAYTNVNGTITYNSTGIKMITNPIILYIDKSSFESRFMFDQNSVVENTAEFLEFFHDSENAYIDSINYNDKNINITLKENYHRFIYPIENLLERGSWDEVKKEYTPITDITIIPDSYLYKIPFGALINNDGEYFINNYNISYSNSFSLLLNNDNTNLLNRNSKVLAIGDAIYDKKNNFYELSTNDLNRNIILKENLNSNLANEFYNLGHQYFPPIPGTKREIELIKTIFNNTTILEKQSASEGKLKSLSQKLQLFEYDLIHFACHAFYDERYPELSSLVLSSDQNNNQDGFLTLKEIENLNLNTKLVNLSACKTARGEMYVLEGIDGFIQAFFNAGAQSVLSTLWPIEDQSAQIFMEEFYKNYIITNDFQKSLSQTKRKFIEGDFGEDYKNPTYWAPYIYFYRK